MTDVLLVGGGGREHALAWKLAQSPRLGRMIAAPGNPGIAAHARCVPVKDTAIDELVDLARRERPDLVVVGPEVPLAMGLADRLREAGFAVFGPSAAAARLESSKAFSKDLMARHGVPTARFRTFQDAAAARAYCRELGAPLVVKADGLAAGKGVIVCRSLDEADRALALCFEERAFGVSGLTVVVEEFLEGEEASFFAIADGAAVLPLVAAQDHKTVFDADRGPNTGGMGAYSPAPVMSDAMQDRVMAEIVRPVIAAMGKEGAPYTGRALRRPDDHPRGAEGHRVQLPLRRPGMPGDHAAPRGRPARAAPGRRHRAGAAGRARVEPGDLGLRGDDLRRLSGRLRDGPPHHGRRRGRRAARDQRLPRGHRDGGRRARHRGGPRAGRAGPGRATRPPRSARPMPASSGSASTAPTTAGISAITR